MVDTTEVLPWKLPPDAQGRQFCAFSASTDVYPRVAIQILRHSKIAITMEIYTEIMSSATCEALRKLSDQLGP
jgi:hypothetical protein